MLSPLASSGLTLHSTRLHQQAGCRPQLFRCRYAVFSKEQRRAVRQPHSFDGSSHPQEASSNADAKADVIKRYNVMMVLVARLLALPDKTQLHSFLRAKPEAISVPFLSWVAEQEASAVGEQKRVLEGICEELVTFREQLEDERLDALYTSTLSALTAGEADPGSAALALAARPEQYAVRLAEQLTGSPVRTEGYDRVYDVLLKVAPPAALTLEGVRKGHEMARELATDLRARRKRSVQSMIGRAQLTAEQADRLMAGTNASRILDMLLALPSTADRLACLPDCFTPPPLAEEDPSDSIAALRPDDTDGAGGDAPSPPSPSPSPDTSAPSGNDS
ncbi:hypothetical protein Agub_g3233, partial [Astrephomene gubernaculifera]